MEVSDKLRELDMTSDEVDRFTQAFKDERFREMLREYAEEISDPENKKKYEEEMTLLEQERGNHVDFIHPEPFRALRTSVDGKQKCFINICSNEKVAKPECAPGQSEDGRRGQRWSLPHSLHPGRPHSDKKGVKQMVYDVVFHPDTLHIAGKNSRFMDMVKSTAIQGIENAFKVTLDSKNVRELKVKYKGTPQPCIIRKPIPGYEAKESPEGAFSVPYPDPKPKPAGPQNFQIKPETSHEPTKPNCSIKYRSYVDMQDYTCSKDSTQRTRPKEIVVTIDLPLLKTVADTNLDVKEKMLLLECEKPSYKLELPLSFPVDGDKGEAKFNKHKGQLTVTLPVLPPPSLSHVLSLDGDEEKKVVEDVTESQMEHGETERLESRNETIQGADSDDTTAEETRKEGGDREAVENKLETKKEKMEAVKENTENVWREVEERNGEIGDTLKGKEVDFTEDTCQKQVSEMDCRNEKILGAREEDEPNTNKADLMEGNAHDSIAVQEPDDIMKKMITLSVVEPDKSLADQKVHGQNEVSQQAPKEVQKSSSIHHISKESSEEEQVQEEMDFREDTCQKQVNEMDCSNEKILGAREEDEPNTNEADLVEGNAHDSTAVQEPEDIMKNSMVTLDSVVEPDRSLEMNMYADQKVHGQTEMSQQAPEEVKKSSSIHHTDKESSEEEQEIKCERLVEERPECVVEGKKIEEQNQQKVEEPSHLHDEDAASQLQRLDSCLELHMDSSHPTEHSDMHPVEQDVEVCQVPQADAAAVETSVICSGSNDGVDEDDLPSEQILQTPVFVPPAVLREVGKDGKETIICDHHTSAGFTFQNSLLFELD
ncbi:protein kintoun isoform 1-T1 [Synchiropus picturatus]